MNADGVQLSVCTVGVDVADITMGCALFNLLWCKSDLFRLALLLCKHICIRYSSSVW